MRNVVGEVNVGNGGAGLSARGPVAVIRRSGKAESGGVLGLASCVLPRARARPGYHRGARIGCDSRRSSMKIVASGPRLARVGLECGELLASEVDDLSLHLQGPAHQQEW